MWIAELGEKILEVLLLRRRGFERQRDRLDRQAAIGTAQVKVRARQTMHISFKLDFRTRSQIADHAIRRYRKCKRGTRYGGQPQESEGPALRHIHGSPAKCSFVSVI